MSALRLEYLLDCYVKNKCSLPEEEELMAILADPENEALVQTVIDHLIEHPANEKELSDSSAVTILQRILKNDDGLVIPEKNSKTGYPFWIRIAASVLVLLVGAYFIFDKKQNANRKDDLNKVAMLPEKPATILPGRNRAMLTTADGNSIILDSIQNGMLTKLGHTNVKKQDGLLIYKASAVFNGDTQVSYNTLSTPRGGQYQIILSDGSKVWLNAASSIRFPTVFSGKLREVTLTGEAYFEVAKNKEKPFQVKVGDMKIAVLGTHFNVNAYEDEAEIKTSLLEGSVRINNGNGSGVLQPGQQAVVNNKSDQIKTGNVDLKEVMAWKNGLFRFEGADITTIMREIGRWYDVEIVYTGKVPNHHFVGKINRNVELSEVLRILELSNVKFSVAGNKIIVL
jgi:transmembrane sensor